MFRLTVKSEKVNILSGLPAEALHEIWAYWRSSVRLSGYGSHSGTLSLLASWSCIGWSCIIFLLAVAHVNCTENKGLYQAQRKPGRDVKFLLSPDERTC